MEEPGEGRVGDTCEQESLTKTSSENRLGLPGSRTARN